MLREWISSQYLGHQNLKNALLLLKRSFENVALSAPSLIVYPDTITEANNLGGQLRVATTFMYRIEDVVYLKGLGITQAVNTGDKTCNLIPRTAADQTAASTYNITATYYRAGVLLIDADGVWSVVMAASEAGKSLGISAGGRIGALRYLLDSLDTDDLEDQAIVAFYVIGDGTNAFTATSSVTINTNLDLYQCGGMVVATGQSTDGGQMLGLL